MKKPFTLSIFFPTYNEEDSIRSTVEQALNAVQGLPYLADYEIIIVNDGSKDNTRTIAESLSRENKNVRVINHAKNQGYGAALITGIRNSRMDYIFFTDADLQFDIYELWKLVEYIPEHKIVLGYRAPRRDPFMRILNAKGWNVLNRILFGLKVRDIDCAFKLLDRNLVQNLPLRSRGAMISAEMLIRLQRAKVTFKEVPVTHLPRTMGSPTGAKPGVILRALREMLELYNGELGFVTQKQALRFGMVGILNTVVDFVAYVGLTRLLIFFGDHLVLTKALSFFLGSVCSFVFNRQWTFGRTTRFNFGELVRFYSTVAISIVINAVSMQFFLNTLHLYDIAAVILATVFTFAWNFILSKFWVFNEKTGKVPASA